MTTSRIWIALVGVAGVLALAAACSSSKSGGGVPSCQGNTGTSGAGSAACNTCLQGKCGSDLSAVESSCGAYVSCYDGCSCSDNTCLSGCQSKIDATCQGAYGPLVSCLQQNCSTECTGGGPMDAGGGG